MSVYVLVHGAFRGGWYWRDVARGLRSRGHDVFAPSLTGAGDRRHLEHPTSLQTYVDDIVQLLEAWDLREVILVGHSFGGVVATAASQFCAERIARLVYLDAPEPHDGDRAVDLVPDEQRGAFPIPPTDTVLPPTPMRVESGVDAEMVAWVNARLSPFPVAPSLDPIELTHPAATSLPRVYVFCRDTPPGYPCALTRGRLDDAGRDYQVLPTGHDAPLERADLVTELLVAAAG